MRARTIVWGILTTTIAVVATLQGQQPAAPIDVVDFRPFNDAINWIVKEPMTYRVGISKAEVTVPRGFVTDLASIPPRLQSLIQQNGPYMLPAVMHDYLYWKQTCTREQADQLMMLAMIENHVSLADRAAIYTAVRLGGEPSWEQNARERKARQIRILPESHINPRALMVWPTYRAQLNAERVVDGPDRPISSAFCARGSMPTEAALTTP